MCRKLEFVAQCNSLKDRDLSQESVFEYFFYGSRKALFIVNDLGRLLGLITLGKFLESPADIKNTVNENCLSIWQDSLEKMLSEAEHIYSEYHIRSEIPVLDYDRKVIGYITDYNTCYDEKLIGEQAEEAKNKIKKFQRSTYLKKEIDSFYRVVRDAEIYIREKDKYGELFSLFEKKIKVRYLSDQSYIRKIKAAMQNSKDRSGQEKAELIFDFERSNRELFYDRAGLAFVYNIEKFISEFTALVENEDLSRILRITEGSAYQLEDFIADNGMQDIKIASNRLLTKYVYTYMQNHSIPVSLAPIDCAAAMEVSCLVNGVRSGTSDCIGFTYCDLTRQQHILSRKLRKKGIHVFNMRGAVHAKLTENERKRIKSLGRLENLLAHSDNEDLEELYRDDCDEKGIVQYAREIQYSYPVTRRFENDLVVNVDYSSRYVNFENGIRRTCYQPSRYKNTIYFTGPCFALGSFVEDKHTIPSLLAKTLKEKGYNYRIVNLGVLASNDSLRLMDVISLRENDIVINMIYNETSRQMEDTIDPSDVFNAIANREDMFFDKSVHCNRKGNEIYAKVIYAKIVSFLRKESPMPWAKNNIYRTFKRNFEDLHLYNVQEYLDMLCEEKKKIPPGINTIGSIVMNCNPFTLGHGYLVEYALQNCDYLFVFVVQENKSFFLFEDRFLIAGENCAKYRNISVVPSGEMIVSNISFPEYFKREAVRDEENADINIEAMPILDFRLFATYIAPVLGIKKRFIAEEPLDPVTRQYNEYMKRILSAFGLEVEEIPRKMLVDGEIISASKVRKMYKSKDFVKMKEMLPDITYRYLIEKSDKYLRK